MSICTVTQTVKWLHVAAGQRPTLRKWSSGWRSFSKFSFLSSTSDSCRTQLPCGDNETTFFSGFSTYSSCKLNMQTNLKLIWCCKYHIFHKLCEDSKFFKATMQSHSINANKWALKKWPHVCWLIRVEQRGTPWRRIMVSLSVLTGRVMPHRHQIHHQAS